MKICIFIVITSLLLFSNAKCNKIFLLFPIASRSHFNLGTGLAKGFAEAGNDVTLLSPFQDPNPPTNGTYRQLVIPELDEIFNRDNMDMFKNRNMLKTFVKFHSIMKELTVAILNSTHMKTLLEKNETFDAFIVEDFLLDSLKVYSHFFNAHLITFSSIGQSSWINKFSGNPTPLSYFPETTLGYPSKMTFFQRVKNVLTYFLVSQNIAENLMFPTQVKLLKQFYPNSPDLNQIRYNVSLVLLNSHVSTLPPVPLVPQMIPIGGYHIQTPKPLPKDLQNYLDNSKNGVIYFSMGSILKSTNMPKEKVNALLTAFRQLKQNILWKWEDDNLPDKPENVKTEKWLPQSSVLAHPNVKLFITHGGLLSTTEVVYHGKPVLAIPIFGDQPTNAQKMVNGGFALSQEYDHLNDPNELLAKINELLNNPKYYENAQQRSRIMHDQPLKPMEAANYWVDYVIRHKGATHLRVAGAKLPWYVYNLLDVAAFLLSVMLSVIGVIYYLIKRICSRNKNPQNKVKKH